MLGAIAGDIAGSIYEHNNVRTKDIELFTGHSKSKIKEFVTSTFGYGLSRDIDDIRYDYTFDSSC